MDNFGKIDIDGDGSITISLIAKVFSEDKIIKNLFIWNLLSEE
ncbi:MAG: hypothetical protein R6U58_10885 [Bacteroidales bacterium]